MNSRNYAKSMMVTLLVGLALGILLLSGAPSLAQEGPVSATTQPHHLFLPTFFKGPYAEMPIFTWATGPEGVLLRWRWQKNAPAANTFRVYRDGNLIATVRRVNDEAEARALLGPQTWDWLKRTYDVNTIAELHQFLDANPLAAMWLADQHYQVALIRAMGFLDRNAQPGGTYRYEVVAQTTLGPKSLGTMQIQHQQTTVLPAPTGLTEVQVLDDALLGNPDWARAQQNRKADSRVALRWDLPGDLAEPPDPLGISSYDVFRATSLNGPYQRITLRQGEDRPVVPNPSYAPETTPGDHPYQQYPYFYQDNDPALQACRTYYYRVAARDMLGHPRDWSDPAQRSQFSHAIAATPPDTTPPPAPLGLTATPNHATGNIALTWQAAPDAARYILYRSQSPDAAWPGLNPIAASQWLTLTITTATQWTDSSATYEQNYWYVVRAQDAPCGEHPPNLSAPSLAVHAILHDRQPPKACRIESKPTLSRLNIECDEDTAQIFIYCRFDDGPERLIAQEKGQRANIDVNEFFAPALPVRADCRAVAVDEHGNRAQPSNWSAHLPLQPRHPVPKPSAPILQDIATENGGTHGWTAHLSWEAVPGACQSGFRIYREAPRVAETLIATVAMDKRDFEDASVQGGVVYTYTVAAYRLAGDCGPALEVRSQAMPYRVTPAPELPHRTLETLAWTSHWYETGQSIAHLGWQTETKRMVFVVFRSLHQDEGYVALTPPTENLSSYIDSSALHNHYWYMVVALDPVTGEAFAATPPWNLHANATQQMQETVAPGADEWTGSAPQLASSLPSILYFGQNDEFELHVTSYDPKSRLSNLNGWGDLYLHPPSGLLKIRLRFQHLQANADGDVTSGSITLPSDALPIAVQRNLRYEITAMTIAPAGGTANIHLYLPGNIYHHWVMTFPYPRTIIEPWVWLSNANTHADLTFQLTQSRNSPCNDSTSDYFQLDELPWKLIPTGDVTYTDAQITFSDACTLYLERYSGVRPASGQPDANDGLLRSDYHSSNASITADGLAGTFRSNHAVNYTVPFPYGFHLTLMHPTLNLAASAITGGQVINLNNWVSFDYFQHAPATNPHRPPTNDTPEGHWAGALSGVSIGPGGSISARADKANTIPKTKDINWLNHGFTLLERRFELYVPPIQSQRLPWQDALWPTNAMQSNMVAQLEPGLNLRSSHAQLQWDACSTAGPVTFTQVQADLYIRRGGISDWLRATIPTGSPMAMQWEGYQTELATFSLTFLDNVLYDRDVTGAVYLPQPSDMSIAFADATLDANACIETAAVTNSTLTPAYWQVAMHPQALILRPPDPDPTAPGQQSLCLIGEVAIPHLSPAATPDDTAAIPLETCFKPNGQFASFTWQYDQVNYQLDGFAYLLSGLRLSDWATHEAAAWDAAANLAAPPAASWQTHGFVQMDGVLLAPVFGALATTHSDDPPHIYALGWHHYLGFSEQTRAQRTWEIITDITWDFDLVYAQHPERTRGEFVGFRSDDLKVVDMDQALVLNSVNDAVRFDLFLGLSAGTAALRSLAETTLIPLPAQFDDVRPSLETWRSERFAHMDEKYIDLLGEHLWERYEEGQTYADTTAIFDSMKPKDIPLPPDAPLGGGTKKWLKSSGVHLKRMRGNITWMQDSNTGDWDFETLRMSVWLDVDRSTTTASAMTTTQKGPLFHADRITFLITRDNDYILEGKNISSSVFEQDKLTLDATLLVNPQRQRFEGGVLMHKLEVKAVTFKDLGVVLGVGADVYYLGALADAQFQGTHIGGAFLFGRIDPSSVVLRNTGFGDLLDTLAMTGVAPGETLAGGYLRFYGDVPLYDYGCLFNVRVGGKIAVWYFADTSPQHSGPDAWGGQLGGYVTGQLLCVVSARGDLTLTLYQQPARENISMRGQFWVAGGIGACDPGSWDTWEHRWWHDSWCWTCGAMVEANYNVDKLDDWAWVYEADYE